MNDGNAEYAKCEKTIMKLAHKYSWVHGTFRQDIFEEMVSAGNIGFCKALDNFDDTKGAKFNTFVYTCAERSMIDALRKERKYASQIPEHGFADESWVEVYEDSMLDSLDAIKKDLSQDSERRCMIHEMLTSMSFDSREIVRYIMNSPEEILNASKSCAPKNVRGALKTILREKGLKWEQIYDSFREIRTELELL